MLVTTLFILQTRPVFGNITNNVPSKVGRFQQNTFFASTTGQISFATTTSATSTNILPWTDSNNLIDNGYFVVAGARHVDFYFSRDAGTGQNQGSSVFKVQGTPDGTNWYDITKLVQNTPTSTTPATLSSITIGPAATSTVIVGLDMVNFNFYAVRCIAIITTDGSNKCSATADF